MIKKEIQDLLNKSESSIAASEVLLAKNFFSFSASRSYYAMFYTAEALLLYKNLSYSSHKAVIGSFGREFVKTQIFDQKYHQYLIKAFDLRSQGDYGPDNIINKEEAYELIEYSKDFLNAVCVYIKSK